jgi:hypothetical protein
MDAVEETAKAGQIDGGGAVQLQPDSVTLLAGVHVKNTDKIESGLTKLEAAAKKQPDFPGIKWNAANHGGVAFHTLSLPVPADEERARQLLGDQLDVAVGIGPESAYIAVGKNNLDAINKAIDASASDSGKKVKPFELAISLRPIMETVAAQPNDEKHKAMFEKIAAYLQSEAKGSDHIRLVGEVLPNGVSYHFEAEQGVLKSLGVAAAEAQKQKEQAQLQQQ